MEASGGNRKRWAAAGIGAAALVGAGAFAGWQYMEQPAIASITPTADGAVSSTSPTIVVALERAERLGDLRVRLNGRDVTAAARGAKDRIVVPTTGLRDGPQRVSVSFSTGNLFARTVSEDWTFEVDTAPPTLEAKGPRTGDVSKRKAVRFTGTTEPGTAVAVSWNGGTKAGTASAAGAYTLTARLPEGDVAATVTASDRAGNASTSTQQLIVDTIAPVIAVSGPKPGAKVTDTNAPRVLGTVVKDDPSVLMFGATVNGKNAIELSGAAAVPPGDVPDYVETGATAAPLELDGRKFSLAVGELPQGLNTIQVWARDRAGNVSRKRVRVLVDSSEEFGAADLRQGARGEDVKKLNERLKEARVLRGKATGTFGPRTRQAVLRYQKRHKLRRTGVVDERTRDAMVGRIVVDLSEYTLRLIRDGRVVRKYKVAIGQAAYPTPTGNYEVVNKQVDPTWIPPDSPWAAGLGAIPPGPGNPLGTRWIGTSAPAVGIHGTYADYSVGTAASHGCMRMHIKDVEALYEEVTVGMPVQIKA